MKKTVRCSISGMHCTSCAMNIDGDLEDTDGIFESNTSYIKQVTEVVFDEAKVSEQTIVTIIKKTGYEAVITK